MYYLILVILTVIILIVATKSSLLRNQVFNESNFLALAASEGLNKPKPAFSLGRSQFAFWTVIVVSSFIFVYVGASPQTYAAPVLADVNLILLGIAAATTIASTTIDGSQRDTLNDIIPQQDYPSQGFLRDIISDENGVNIHRLQNVIWTIIIGVIYIAYVAAKSKMPDDTVITTQLLVLMGISSGAYLGLKTTENQTPTANTVAGLSPAPSSRVPIPPVAPVVNPVTTLPIPQVQPSIVISPPVVNPVPSAPVPPVQAPSPVAAAPTGVNVPRQTPPVQ